MRKSKQLKKYFFALEVVPGSACDLFTGHLSQSAIIKRLLSESIYCNSKVLFGLLTKYYFVCLWVFLCKYHNRLLECHAHRSKLEKP